MNYDEYIREGHFRYEAFARTVRAVLQAAIDDSGEDFRLQQIGFRAKSTASLHRKLKERDLLESQTIETELKDLARCRLIFYTNTDVDRFLNSRLLFENFKVDFDGSKIHHAVGKDRPAEELYFALHYLISLTDERLALPEYGKFRGLRCEIQIQTILNHAWAETTHDILYHRPEIEGFGTKQFAAIKERLTKIMNKYLLPAGYEFQLAQADFERLRLGKELFDHNTVEALRTADNNNERYEHLRRIKEDLLPYYDDVPGVAPEVIRSVVEAITKARMTPVKEIETPLGNMPGHTAEQVVNAGLQIIEDLRYIDIQGTFRVLCDLYASASSGEERRRIIQATERLAHNDINVWRQVGPLVQKLLQESISALSDAERAAIRPLVLTVAGQILDPEVTGSTWHFQSVSLHTGAVQPSETLGLVRSNVLDLLFSMYGEAKTDQEKREIIHALDEAARLPGTANYGDALTAMVLDDTRRIVQFFADRADTEEFERLQTIEDNYLWLHRRTKEIAQAQTIGRSEIAEKANAVIAVIKLFRDRANSRDDFVRFKTLVGYESVFPPEWEGDAIDVEGPAAYRTARIAEYVASVTDKTADDWFEEIRRCASVQSNDMATFPSFCEFLNQLANRSPVIMFGYLEKGDDVLSRFLPPILAGLRESEQAPAALKLIERWVDQGLHLSAIARHLRLIKEAPIALIRSVGHKALDAKDLNAITEIIAAVIANGATELVDSVVVPGIRHFTTVGNTGWIRDIWFMPELQGFIRVLSQFQCDAVLQNLTLSARIDHYEERILQPIAENFPESVWRFLKSRLDHETPDDLYGKYEAIPYELHKLREPLSRDAGLAVDSVRSWYHEVKQLFQYRGGKILRCVFPSFSPELEAKLISVVREGGDEPVDFVLKLLRSYQGQTFLHGVCKEIVDSLPENDGRLGEVEVILETTGVVSGQFGLVDAYQRKKEEVASWLSDGRPKVRAFAEKYQRSLVRAIAAEQRRSEADYELRRREWPEEDEKE